LCRISLFLEQFPICEQEQFPPFANAVNNKKFWYYTQYQNNEIVAFACISIRKFIFAEILFGPIVQDTKQFDSVLNDIALQLKRKGVCLLRVMPPLINIAHKTDDYESHASFFNWATLQLNIEKDLAVLFQSFAPRHKGSIKKAQKMGLSVSVLNQEADISTFAEGYTAMYQHRGLSVDESFEKKRFTHLFNCFQTYKNGLFLGIYNPHKELIGGICVSIQSNTMTYYKGYAHPKFRQLPISHIGIFEAIRQAQQLGKTCFDFGGYAIEPHIDKQLAAINFFKKGFGGSIVTFPPTRIYYLRAFAQIGFKALRTFKTLSRNQNNAD
jgi:lipid II:glycine glycyltransferase (peptidoglycan interpeptide bridge formation enzyme)